MLHPVFWKRAASAALLAACASLVWAQQGSEGTVTITVTDPSGSVVPGAKVQLRDPATNSVRSGATQDSGAYSFVNLPIGHYTLTVSKPGFSTQSLPSVVVQAARVTDVPVKLQVGATTVTVEVKGGAAPVLETTSNSIGTTIDIKQIEDLPIQGRDLTSLANLTPGYNGTWDGLPSNAQGNNVDGVIGSPTRMKFGGNAHPSVTPRLEDIAQMTVQTSQLNLNQGFGQATMQINFVTRRGTNQFHGRVFEDFQNSVLNANSWYNDAAGLPKSHLELNNFGGSVGGPILKNKLFFFGSFSMSKQPGSFVANNDVLTSAAQAGNFTYTGSDGAVHTVNVLDTARNYDSTINPTIASELQSINKSLSAGAVTPTSDPNMNTLSWLQPSPTTYYYPTFRIDYNMSDALHFDFAYNETKEVQPSVSQSFFPGPDYADQIAGNKADNKTLALGIEWTISPTLVNEFRGGFNYNATWYAYNSAPLYDTLPQISWDFPNGTGNMSGQNFNLPITTYYPVFNASDTMTWQHNKHTFMYGFSWYREQDHYWNNPEGYPNIRLGLSTGDPALSAFSNTGANATLPAATSAQLGEAEQLYAILTGRIGNASGASSVIGQFAKEQNGDQYRKGIGAFNLDELQSAWGLFFQDSWHVTPTLTLNYGLRWDFTGDDHDLTGSYHGATLDSIYGPSGVGNLFRPGYLPGDMNPTLTAREHQYNGWDVTPQPAFGFAWNPKFASGFLGKLTGNGKTVIRGGYSLRRFTEPHQYFWNNASDYGSFFYQNFFLNANTSGTPGSFAPGSLTLGNPFPPYGLAPATYLASAPLADYTFTGTIGANGFNQNIDQPYTESWNFGIQREIGNDSVLEIRYNGNRTIHQWLQLDTNEVNIFENGFLKQFQTAQQNFKINQQHGISSFANNGYAGQQATPIFNAAFAGEKSGGAGVPLSDYGNTTFINELNTGQAGAMAGTLSSINGTAPYFCNLVGSSFTPCVTNAGYTGPGAGYPINFFQANPFSPGTSLGYQGTPASLMDSPGYSNYNALQVDFRQRPWHGIEFDANYTWSHTLGIETPNSWTASFPNYTLRNLHLAYGPALFDHRHVVHVNATVDLPFGKGREWMNRGGIL
ncbi:MAG: carboxypeptidase regulatory-like domain-containing protein, partial [Candidatus Acidiferrales bacterium]